MHRTLSPTSDALPLTYIGVYQTFSCSESELDFNIVWNQTIPTMKITDRGMTVELDDGDPRAKQIRTLLFTNAGDKDPIVALWSECSDDQREVLVSIATPGEITQGGLEIALGGISGIDLRGRTIALAKISKRLGIAYPIRSAGGRRETRRFSLAAEVARQVLKLHSRTKRERKTP